MELRWQMIGVLLTCIGGWLPCLERDGLWGRPLYGRVGRTENGMVVMWLVI